MQKLKHIEKHFRNIGIVLNKNKMYIKVANQELFKPIWKKGASEFEIFYNFYKDVLAITEIIKEISENNRLVS